MGVVFVVNGSKKGNMRHILGVPKKKRFFVKKETSKAVCLVVLHLNLRLFSASETFYGTNERFFFL